MQARPGYQLLALCMTRYSASNSFVCRKDVFLYEVLEYFGERDVPSNVIGDLSVMSVVWNSFCCFESLL